MIITLYTYIGTQVHENDRHETYLYKHVKSFVCKIYYVRHDLATIK